MARDHPNHWAAFVSLVALLDSAVTVASNLSIARKPASRAFIISHLAPGEKDMTFDVYDVIERQTISIYMNTVLLHVTLLEFPLNTD